MYALFRLHGWKPSDYYSLGYGERRIVSAFLRKETEDMAQQ